MPPEKSCNQNTAQQFIFTPNMEPLSLGNLSYPGIERGVSSFQTVSILLELHLRNGNYTPGKNYAYRLHPNLTFALCHLSHKLNRNSQTSMPPVIIWPSDYQFILLTYHFTERHKTSCFLYQLCMYNHTALCSFPTVFEESFTVQFSTFLNASQLTDQSPKWYMHC